MSESINLPLPAVTLMWDKYRGKYDIVHPGNAEGDYFTADQLRAAIKETRAKALEEAAKVVDEMQEHYAAYKDTALLNGDVELSIAASGEPRACEFLATAIRSLIDAAPHTGESK